ncbi:uncharacterized protein LOC123715166 [Pieris brassicae]|uniref:uncharacterized protein LOC123715166 n=1 Tax=Pieris brassicae TaxID=7116 RepID=UPI001E661538|nr:uncharacterized protein LOC123715166 [Pieris brassicae]
MDKTVMGPPKILKTSRRQSVVPSTSKKLSAREIKTRQNVNATLINDASVFVDNDGEDLAVESISQKCLRDVLADCLVDMKIKREETDIDIQITQLADRFSKTVDQLEKTNRRLKDISFVVEQKRLLDLKTIDCSRFHETIEGSGVTDILNNLVTSEQAYLDKLETKNIDFGYNKETGHKQLLDAVNDAIDGLEEIKKHSGLDIDKLKQFEVTQTMLDEVEKEKFDIENLKSEFEKKFPKFCDKLLQEVSEKLDTMLKAD